MSKVEEYAAFLDSIHIFIGISDYHLFEIAERLEVLRFKAGDVIIANNEQAKNFYLIFSGKVEVLNKGKGQKKAVYKQRDYFGEESLLPNETREFLVKAKTDVVLLTLPGSSFAEIPDALSFLRGSLEASLSCRSLSKKMHFDWVEDDEAIYFIVRKHPILFWKASVLAILLGVFGIISSFWGMWVGSYFALIVGVLSFIISTILVIWFLIDWRNDYYAVTSERVVWFEKVVGLHESRQDVYLHEILSIGVESDMYGEFFNYATLSIRTMVDTLTLKYTPCSAQAKDLIEELWQHAKIEESQKKEDQLHQAIIDKIKSVQPVTPIKKRPAPPPEFVDEGNDAIAFSAPLPSKKKVKLFKKKAKPPKKDRHLFDLHYEQGAEVIYRKHWVILLFRASVPVLITLSLFAYFIWQLYLIILLKSDQALSISFVALLAVAGFLSSGWAIYQYMDWSNDIFKVSPSKIFDIDRKPFGDIQSRSAPIENIESTEYKRSGILSIFFNYGTVYIHIGAEHFEFENVYNPASVQQNINRRYMRIRENKIAAEAKKKRDAMLPWLIAYHQSADKFNDMMAKIAEAEAAQAEKDALADEEGDE